MSSRTRFFINGAWMTFTSLAVRTVGIIFASYISGVAMAEGLGLFTLIMTVFSFAATLATAGTSLSVTRLVAGIIGEGRESPARILRGAFLYALVFGGAATLGLLLLCQPLCLHVLKDMRALTPLRTLAFSLLPAALSSVIAGYFVGVRRVGFNGALGVFSQVFRVFVTVLLLRRAEGVAEVVSALCLGITLSDIAVFAFSSVLYLLSSVSHRRGRGVNIRPVAGMALPIAVSAYIRSILLSVEHNLIPRGLERRGESHSEALASYGLLHGMALPVLTYPMALISSFAGLLVPEFAEELAKGGSDRMKRIASLSLGTTASFGAVCSVLIYLFSEELGYLIYDSFGAGYYIAFLSPVVTVMYLDHITDSILKGIGEQVYSMVVNIADAALSVLLVLILIPLMGISGYAVVILAMELFNFTLSFLRLKKRINPTFSVFRTLLLPSACAILSACLTRALFSVAGMGVTPAILITELVFTLCSTYLLYRVFSVFLSLRRGRFVKTD